MADDTDAMSDEAMDDGESMSDESMDDESMSDESMSDEAMDDGEAMSDESMTDGAGALDLDVSALPVLDGGLHYEGWAIIDGEPVTTGKFVVTDGLAYDLFGNEILGHGHGVDLADATALVVALAIDPVAVAEVIQQAREVPVDEALIQGGAPRRSGPVTPALHLGAVGFGPVDPEG